ncbi:DEAD/DEAH box helicase [Turicibacter bilis]|uniref:RNA helicase n=1 Tax=Turicibacter bilis TaxID=2735723 RepID=A0A9Q9CHE1_9FIRM|nr:DEAD/DEAH box helicase [Turicibacter bilis]MBS3198536.1 DEAD/DEAH box helicase [Turicibacter bilis]UUF08685.1 DEAD/DEAH box helicase [Turicibacter bilis]
MNFKDLGISEPLVQVLKKSGITTPTPIQEECIPLIKDYKDVIAQAQTGTGKTLAFLLPLFENISPDVFATQALIITPTRELALQITEEANQLANGKAINVLAAYGGRNIGSQLNKLKGTIHLIIATPGRLIDHIERGTIDLNKIKTVVIDEADQMLLMGFRNEVDQILRATPRNRQTLCFSATMAPNVKKLAYHYTYSPTMVTIEPKKVTIDTIRQEVIETTDRWKADTLCQVLEEDNPFLAIIFARTKRRADELFAKMKKRGFNVQVIHSDIAQNKRERILKSFRDADLQYLIATDVASRGLDISGVTHIYNYDVPETPEIYIHRIGRTGRAGEDGYTCMFVAPKDNLEFNMIERKLRRNLPKRQLKEELRKTK